MSKTDRKKWRRVDFNDLPSEGKILSFFSLRVRARARSERHTPQVGFSRYSLI
jgi:hypothetical protein